MKANFKTLAKILALSSGCSLVAMSHANNTIDFTGTVAETTCSASIIIMLHLLKWGLSL